MNEITLVPTLLSVAVYVAGVLFLARALSRDRRPRKLERVPRVSILKPLAGHDDELEENLASFAKLDYPEYEVLFGVASALDPALAEARRFLRRYPFVDARIVVTDPRAATNPKVAQLIGLEARATGEILVISDSNVRVRSDYLGPLVSALLQPDVALVSSVVAGSGERTVGAAIENLNLAASVAPLQVLLADGVRQVLSVGKSMALWRHALHEIGGFTRVREVLAEDYLLGRLLERAGHRVVLSARPIENRNVDCTVVRSLERHARWARMRRSVAPIPFTLEPIGCPILIATATLLADPSRLHAAALGTVAVLQVACAYLCVRMMRGRAPALLHLPAEILRGYLLFACWLGAWLGRRVEWRGHPFLLEPGSVLRPITTAPGRTPSSRAPTPLGRGPTASAPVV